MPRAVALLLFISSMLLLFVQLHAVEVNVKNDNPPVKTPRNPGDSDILKAATYLMDRLRQLSDSGIYQTLALKRIITASTAEGIFHHNTFLTLELTSPYFLSGKAAKTFDAMVMRSYDDEQLSFAIDEFPEMDPDAIEEFWIERVEEKRARREEYFARLEAEVEAQQAAQAEAEFYGGNADPASLMLSMKNKPVMELWTDVIQKFSRHDPRAKTAKLVLDEYWTVWLSQTDKNNQADSGTGSSSPDGSSSSSAHSSSDRSTEDSISFTKLCDTALNPNEEDPRRRVAARNLIEQRLITLGVEDALEKSSTARLIGIASDSSVPEGRRQIAQMLLEKRVQAMTAAVDGTAKVRLPDDIPVLVPEIPIGKDGLPAKPW